MTYLFKRKKPTESFPLFARRKPTIEELCSGKFGDTQKALKLNQELRNEYATGSRGYTPTRVRRHVANIPIDVLFNPELKKYFDPRADMRDGRKDLHLFLKKFPMFKVVDKV